MEQSRLVTVEAPEVTAEVLAEWEQFLVERVVPRLPHGHRWRRAATRRITQLRAMRAAADVSVPAERRPDVDMREVLGTVVVALEEAISQLPASNDWKWACVGIRRHMLDSLGRPPLRLAARAAAD